jgi:hypothetical protein
MITLSEQNLADLKAFINKIPTEIGLPLLEFFGKLQQEQAPQEAPVVDLKKQD